MPIVQSLYWCDQFLFFCQRPSLPKTFQETSHHYDCDRFVRLRRLQFSFMGLIHSLIDAIFCFVALDNDLKNTSTRTSKSLVMLLPFAHWCSSRDRIRWSFGKVKMDSLNYQLWQSSFQRVPISCFPSIKQL